MDGRNVEETNDIAELGEHAPTAASDRLQLPRIWLDAASLLARPDPVGNRVGGIRGRRTGSVYQTTIAGFSLWSGMAGPARSTGSRRSTLMVTICPDRSRLRRRRTALDEELGRLADCCDELPRHPGGLRTRDLVYSPIWLSTALPTAQFGTVARICYPTELRFGIVVSALVGASSASTRQRASDPRLRVGMTRADVLAEVGGDWRARPALGRPVRFFEAEDIPVQLVLDERDLVVEVRPWPFI